MKYKNQAKLIRNKRLKLKLHQRDIADKLGLSSTVSISNIERGVTGVPPKEIKRYAEALGLKLTSLIQAMVKDHKDFLASECGGL